MDAEFAARLDLCERANLRLRRWSILQSLLLLIALAGITANAWSEGQPAQAAPTSLRVQELVVVDGQGVERVRIGGELPDALIGGRKVPRGERAAGVLLYDGTGQERSGYLSWEPSGNVGLTLDTRQAQVGILVAGPDGGSALQLWHGRDLIELRSDEDGSRLTGVKAGSVLVQQPAVPALTTRTCAAYREALERVSPEQVMRDCRRRFDESPCTTCLGPFDR